MVFSVLNVAPVRTFTVPPVLVTAPVMRAELPLRLMVVLLVSMPPRISPELFRVLRVPGDWMASV
jgi:hypothetical protein